MGRAQVTAVGLALVAVLIGAGLGSARYEDDPPSAPIETTSETVSTGHLFVVYVSGWVATPGVVEVPEGSIVAHVVAAAGGALDGALLDAINLARPVVDGDHIQIPGPGDPVVPVGGQPNGLISPNRADAAELETLPGVGPVLAERIVSHRETHGPFETVEDLLDVSGIGEAKLAAFRDLIVVP